MPVFRLTRSLIFPPVDRAEADGLLAVGGDLSPERLLLAYSLGIFPWYARDLPILWWSPDPRLVLFPNELKISRSLLRVLRKRVFHVTLDVAFREVMERCASVPRKQNEGTWIVPEMIEAYCRLHRLGYAHSVEVWYEGDLVGGLYGIALGRVFFGESMFSMRSDASKVALVYLVDLLRRWDFRLIDCQVTTGHLMRMGAREISRREFLTRLSEGLETPFPRRLWSPTDLVDPS
ncbi:MAG: leucyl/phenylalanyl-tRNA--protein transferase [Deltaproteobacteria bacterium]|nr:leucyl/phenylalanyl-tRNA--protein transferase [Deltaproteobacteria bacterium]